MSVAVSGWHLLKPAGKGCGKAAPSFSAGLEAGLRKESSHSKALYTRSPISHQRLGWDLRVNGVTGLGHAGPEFCRPPQPHPVFQVRPRGLGQSLRSPSRTAQAPRPSRTTYLS